MHCLDCRTAGANSTAVGICQSCGAGVCTVHAHVEARSLRRGSPLGAPVEAAARRVLCPVCAVAGVPSEAVLTP